MTLVSKFLNSPFGLWLLSSVAIAGFLSFASEQQRCYSAALTVIPKLAKAASERDLRMLEIGNAIHSGKPQPAIDADIKSIVAGSTYFYRDYQGKSLLDVEFDLAQSVLETADLGQKEEPDLEALTDDAGAISAIIALSGLSPIDQRVFEELPGKISPSMSRVQYIGEKTELGKFPYVDEDTAKKFDKLLEETPCQPFDVVRSRIKRCLHGL